MSISFGQRLSFFFNAHNDFLEEVAKFRAARRLWARIMRERFGATNPRAHQLRFHTQTAGSTLTAQQPDNNIVRVAIQALAAVLGGTQSLHCNGRDEALGLPTEESARIGAADAANHRVRNRRRQYRRSVRRRVGDRRSHESYRGRGSTARSTESPQPAARLPPSSMESSSARSRTPPIAPSSRSIPERPSWWGQSLRGGRRRRDRRPANRSRDRATPEGTSAAGARVTRHGRMARGPRRASLPPRTTGRNLVPPIIRAVEARATVGEISDALRSVFGEHKEI